MNVEKHIETGLCIWIHTNVYNHITIGQAKDAIIELVGSSTFIVNAPAHC